jgi:SOS-response transcriptional repressor LexA
LKRLAEAFELHPIELFITRKKTAERRDRVAKKDLIDNSRQRVTPKMVPVMKDIPAHPSPYNNELMQITSGYKGVFIPVVGFEDNDMFCVKLENNSLRPRFTKGDYVIVSPAAQISSGDVVAVEYGDKNVIRALMQVSYGDDLVILESLSHKHAPVALTRSKDTYRFVGKVVMRYQKVD